MRIGIDLGGTKIEGVVLDDEGQERWRSRRPTPARDGADAIVEAVARLVSEARAAVGLPHETPVGIGTPGAISPATGRLQGSNTTCLNGLPLDARFAEVIGAPVRVQNDANCFALSEAVDGAGAGADVVFGVILGTGTGGGLVVGGQPLAGANAIAGEWGHNPLPWPRADDAPAPSCYCGRAGCLETYLSGPGIAADHARVTGEKHTAAELAGSDSMEARATLGRHRDRLARGLATVVNLLDPDVIVLGGGVSNLPGLADAMPEAMGPYVFTRDLRTAIRRAQHGDASGVRGAAWLWPQ